MGCVLCCVHLYMRTFGKRKPINRKRRTNENQNQYLPVDFCHLPPLVRSPKNKRPKPIDLETTIQLHWMGWWSHFTALSSLRYVFTTSRHKKFELKTWCVAHAHTHTFGGNQSELSWVENEVKTPRRDARGGTHYNNITASVVFHSIAIHSFHPYVAFRTLNIMAHAIFRSETKERKQSPSDTPTICCRPFPIATAKTQKTESNTLQPLQPNGSIHFVLYFLRDDDDDNISRNENSGKTNSNE